MKTFMKFLAIRSELIGLVFLLIVTVTLRFINLSYSDYVRDEQKTFFDNRIQVSAWQFFLEQRKGPMQVVVSYIPYLITRDFHNELAQRIPYSIISTISIFIFYKLVSRLTSSKLAGLLAALLLTVNGFIVAFGRIVQYQNLNLIFSFSSLYLYSELLVSKKHLVGKTLWATMFFSLSLMSHWDAVFIVPVIIIIFFQFLRNKEFKLKFKILLILTNFIFGCIVLLPFLVPYIKTQMSMENNKNYFSRRVGVGEVRDLSFRTLIELYNPFITYWFLIVGGFLGSFFVKKSYYFVVWFITTFLLFYFFVQKPGTHVYNFVIPLLILAAVFFERLIHYLPKYLKLIPIAAYLVLFSFFYYQSYILFVDHKVEYPWKQETIFNRTTTDYIDYPTLPLFGFPLRRDWDAINDFINQQNRERNEEYGYMTNEDASTSSYYMDADYRTDNGFYYIGVKRPLNFVNDWKAPQIKGKVKVYEIKVDGETVVHIYRVEPRPAKVSSD